MRRVLRASLLLLLLVLGSWAAAVTANSSGRVAETVYALDGCSCHGPRANPATRITLAGIADRYEPGVAYRLTLSSETDVLPSPLGTHGGFLAYVTNGTLAPRGTPAGWYQTGQLSAGPAFIEHTRTGAQENLLQRWEFDWTSPKPAIGVVALVVFVNRVNGDGSPTAEDHWNRWSAEILGPGELARDASVRGNDEIKAAEASAVPAFDAFGLGVAVAFAAILARSPRRGKRPS